MKTLILSLCLTLAACATGDRNPGVTFSKHRIVILATSPIDPSFAGSANCDPTKPPYFTRVRDLDTGVEWVMCAYLGEPGTITTIDY